MRYDAVLLDDLGVLSATADGSLLPYVLEVRARGVLTAVVSNADGPPRPGLQDLGPVVLSGESGLRKPAPAAANVRGAVAAGMTGVHHVSLERTLQELAALLV